MSAATRVVRCPNCQKNNRVPAVAEGRPKCGNRHHLLPWIADADDASYAQVVEEGWHPGSGGHVGDLVRPVPDGEPGAGEGGHRPGRSHPVAVVGGANSAGQAALFLAAQSPHVYLVVRGDDLSTDMSRYLVDRIESDPRIEVLLHSEVRAAEGDKAIASVVVEDYRSGEQRTLPVRALFVFIGAKPGTEWLAGTLALDDRGAVLTGHAAAEPGRARHWRHPAREPYVLEQRLPGQRRRLLRHGSSRQRAETHKTGRGSRRYTGSDRTLI